MQMTYAGLHVRDYLRYDFAYTKKHSEWELPILQVQNWACPSTRHGAQLCGKSSRSIYRSIEW